MQRRSSTVFRLQRVRRPQQKAGGPIDIYADWLCLKSHDTQCPSPAPEGSPASSVYLELNGMIAAASHMRRLSSAVCRARRRVPSVSDLRCRSAAAFRICSKRLSSTFSAGCCGSGFFTNDIIVYAPWSADGSAPAFARAPFGNRLGVKRKERWRMPAHPAGRAMSVPASSPSHRLQRTAAS